MARPRAVPEWMVTLLVGLLGAAAVRADLTLDLLMPGVTTKAPDSYRAFAVSIPTDLDNTFVGARTCPLRRGSPPLGHRVLLLGPNPARRQCSNRMDDDCKRRIGPHLAARHPQPSALHDGLTLLH